MRLEASTEMDTTRLGSRRQRIQPTCTIAEAVAFLDAVQFDGSANSRVNPSLTKQQAWEILRKGLDKGDQTRTLHPIMFRNICREFNGRAPRKET